MINLGSQGKHQTVTGSAFQTSQSLLRMEEGLFQPGMGLGGRAFMFPSVILWSALSGLCGSS